MCVCMCVCFSKPNSDDAKVCLAVQKEWILPNIWLDVEKYGLWPAQNNSTSRSSIIAISSSPMSPAKMSIKSIFKRNTKKTTINKHYTKTFSMLSLNANSSTPKLRQPHLDLGTFTSKRLTRRSSSMASLSGEISLDTTFEGFDWECKWHIYIYIL
jgi:hypothetical protein